MLKTLSHLFTPRSSNNYKAKTLHLSSLSIFILLIMLSQIVISLVGKAVPGVLGIASSITAQELISLTNDKRSENGLAPLSLNQTLVSAAALKGSDMIAKNYWAHTAPDGATPWSFIKQAGYYYLYAGENLARDFGDSSSLVNAWMDSPTHRDNILSPRYTEIGIAVIHDNFQGQETTLAVQMFGAPINAPLTQIAPQEPKIAVVTDETIVPHQEQVIGLSAESVFNQIPSVSSFQLTKAVSVSLTIILLVVIVIDTMIITKKKIVRLSGKGMAHLLFLGILLTLLLGIQPGLIL